MGLCLEFFQDLALVRGELKQTHIGPNNDALTIDSVCTGVATWWLIKGRPIPAEHAAAQIVRDILPDYFKLQQD